jgi:acyl-coenzyme A synthetase/AMP-(fatty) acid ligase
LNKALLIKLAGQSLANFKHPRIIQKVSHLPRNLNGKLIRAELPQLWNPK